MSSVQYYYAPHRSRWGVWKAGEVINGIAINTFVQDFYTKEQARDFVNKMNNNKNQDQ